MGASGSGKSTLLTIAGSLDDPTRGDVYIGGASLLTMSRNDRARLRRRSIGYVFQDFNLLAGLNALENVALPLELDGVPAKKARAIAEAALAGFGLVDRASHYPDTLSGGERQRVSIARAVVGARQLLLADEPTGALGSANGEAVMRMVLAACHRGVAAVVVTHDAQLAAWADRVVFPATGGWSTRPWPRRVPNPCCPPARRHDRHRGGRESGAGVKAMEYRAAGGSSSWTLSPQLARESQMVTPERFGGDATRSTRERNVSKRSGSKWRPRSSVIRATAWSISKAGL